MTLGSLASLYALGFKLLELGAVALLELGTSDVLLATASEELLSAAFSLELSILLSELMPGSTADDVS